MGQQSSKPVRENMAIARTGYNNRYRLLSVKIKREITNKFENCAWSFGEVRQVPKPDWVCSISAEGAGGGLRVDWGS